MGPSPAKPGIEPSQGPVESVYYGVFLPPDVLAASEGRLTYNAFTSLYIHYFINFIQLFLTVFLMVRCCKAPSGSKYSAKKEFCLSTNSVAH